MFQNGSKDSGNNPDRWDCLKHLHIVREAITRGKRELAEWEKSTALQI